MTVQPLSIRRSRRPLMTSDLRSARNLYEEGVPLRQMAKQLGRDRGTLVTALRKLDAIRMRRGHLRTKDETLRRNAKIIDAVLYGDELEDILRRWDISPRVMYAVLLEYRRRTRMKDDVWVKFFGEAVSKIFTRVKENGTSSQF